MSTTIRLRKRTQEALDLLRKHKTATLTNNQTAVRKRGRRNELQVHYNSAEALVNRGYAEWVETDEHGYIGAVKLMEAGGE